VYPDPLRKKDLVEELPAAVEEVSLGGTFFGAGAQSAAYYTGYRVDPGKP
jgi:hypothetical protein